MWEPSLTLSVLLLLLLLLLVSPFSGFCPIFFGKFHSLCAQATRLEWTRFRHVHKVACRHSIPDFQVSAFEPESCRRAVFDLLLEVSWRKTDMVPFKLPRRWARPVVGFDPSSDPAPNPDDFPGSKFQTEARRLVPEEKSEKSKCC